MYICIYMIWYTYDIYVCIYVYIYMYTYICVYIYVYICIHIYVYICIYMIWYTYDIYVYISHIYHMYMIYISYIHIHTYIHIYVYIYKVQFSCSVVSDSLWPHGLQHARLPCPSPASGAYSNSCPLRQWCHPTISSSVVLFSSCLQSFPASGSFQMSQLFASGGQSIGVSASTSVLSMNIRDWFPLWWTGWISLPSKGLSGIFFNTRVQKHQFFGAQLTLI